MNTIRVACFVLISVGLLAAGPVCAEELLTAKVYRDYPGYINPAICDNPNLDAAAKDPAATESAPANKQGASPSQKPASGSMRQCCPNLSGERADDPVGHYLSAWGGVVATHDIDLKHDGDMSLDNGYGVGVAIGYDFGPVRLEVEGNHRRSNGDKIKTPTSEFNAKDDLKVNAVLVNAYADFATGGPTTPYVGIGGGYARAKAKGRDQVGIGQLSVGALFAVNTKVAIDLGYRYTLPVARSDFDLHQHTAMLGLQIRF